MPRAEYALSIFVLTAACCIAQSSTAVLPPGATIPIQVEHALTAGSTRPGTPLHVRTTQRIPLPGGGYLKRGVQITGSVVASSKADPAAHTPARLTLRFDTLRDHGKTTPIGTEAVAAADFVLVQETGEPCSGAVDKANPDAANWTTAQIGGEEVVRSGWRGPLIDSVTHTVGFADYFGVYSTPVAPDQLPHALGVFSSTARGLYGYDAEDTLTSAGGSITLTAPGKLELHGNDNLLLRILPAPQAFGDQLR